MGVSIERELNDLERGITTLRVEYERFFGGELRKPPVQARRAIEEALRRYGNAEIEKAAERFRLQTIHSRINSFAELWEKRLQAKEEGRTGQARRPAPAVTPAADAAKAVPKEARKTPPPLAADEVAKLLAGGQSLIAYALAHLPASFSSVSLLVQPVVAALLAALIVGVAGTAAGRGRFLFSAPATSKVARPVRPAGRVLSTVTGHL